MRPEIMLLRVTVALTCVGAAAQMLLYGGPVFSWLWMDLDWSENAAARVESGAAFGLIAAAGLVFWQPARSLLPLIAAWLLFTALADTLIGTWHPELTIGGHAVRYIAPLALLALLRKQRTGAEWLLRVGTAATFIFHGLQALLMKAEFLDFIIGAGRNLAGAAIYEDSARNALIVIGALDICVGLMILIPYKWRVVAGWLALWGFTTALARVVYAGWGNWPELLIRVANGAAPLTLLLLWRPNHEEADHAK
jgi:uncharacterized membrane protein YphA (DoxX/SURF4 family)